MTVTLTRDQANALRFRPGIDAGRYEVYCLTITAADSSVGAWIRYVVQAADGNPDDAWCEVWATVFRAGAGNDSFGLKRELPIGELDAAAEPFLLRLGEASLSNAAAPGELCHLWGRKHPPHTCWAHCNRFDDGADADFEIMCIPREDDAPEQQPLHIAYVRLGEREHRMVSVLDGSTASNERRTGFWRFAAASETLHIEAEIEGDPTQLVEGEYRDPDGTAWWPVHNDLCSSALEVWTREQTSHAWRSVARLRSTATTHAEWGDWEPHASVANKVLAV